MEARLISPIIDWVVRPDPQGSSLTFASRDQYRQAENDTATILGNLLIIQPNEEKPDFHLLSEAAFTAINAAREHVTVTSNAFNVAYALPDQGNANQQAARLTAVSQCSTI